MADDQPVQSYYPRARLRLTVRLDEFADTTSTSATPPQPPHWRKGIGIDPKAQPTLSVQQGSDGGWYIGSPPTASTLKSYFAQLATSSDNRSFKLDPVLPKKLTIVRNGIRQADTCTATFRYADLPLDPRCIRSLAVEAFLGTVQPSDYASQMTAAASPGKYNTIPDTYTDGYGRPRTNLRFQGFADEISVDFDADDEPLITIEATDLTTLLLDQDAPPKLHIDPTQPLDQAIANYLANFPQFQGMGVVYRPAGATAPTLNAALAKTAFKPQLGPPPAGGAGGGTGSSGASSSKFAAFDYVTDVCASVGLIAYVQGLQIIIQRPRTLYASKFSGRDDDPFTGRILPSGRALTNRLFIYGRNLIKQSFKRKFRKPGQHNNIEIRCFSMKQGKTLVQRFPGTASTDRQKKLTPGNTGDEQWKVMTVAGIEDDATLRAIAQAVYEQSSRPELVIRFQTMNLGSYGGDNTDPDCLDMEAGDPIDVEVARAAASDPSTVQFGEGIIADQMASRPAAFLQDLGFPSDFANAYASSIGNVGLSTTYRTRSISFDFTDDGDNGGGDSDSLTIDIEAVNYIEARQDKSLPDGEEIEPQNTTRTAVTVNVDGAGFGDGGQWI